MRCGIRPRVILLGLDPDPGSETAEPSQVGEYAIDVIIVDRPVTDHAAAAPPVEQRAVFDQRRCATDDQRKHHAATIG